MKKLENFEDYLREGQANIRSIADAQQELDALGWKYKVFRKPIPTSEPEGKVILAIDKMGEIIFIKKMPNTHVKHEAHGKTSRQTETHGKIFSEECRYIPKKRGSPDVYNNFYFFATEFVEYGFEKLREKRVSGAHGLDDIINAFVGYCSGLEFMHNTAKVVHRDIKPSNLRFDIENGEIVPKLIDFGLSCGLDVSFTVTGTLGYMAPELKREGVTSDIYSLGICFYEATSEEGEATVESQFNEMRNSDQTLQKEHSRIENDKSLERAEREEARNKTNIRRFHETREPREDMQYIFEIFKKATQPEPKDRYQSATEFKNDLKIALQHNQLDEIISAFEYASSAAEKIKKSVPFDLSLAEEASRLKQTLYEEFKKENIEVKSSAVIAFVESQIKEKIKPIKDAANAYLNKFRFSGDNSTDIYGMESYSKKIDSMLEAGDPAYRRNILEMVTKLKRVYDLCEMTYPALFKVLLESRALKREALRSQKKASYDELLKQTESILPVPVLMDDSEYNESAIITARLNAYTAGIKEKEPTSKDVQHCLEIKTLLESQKELIMASDDKLSRKFDEFIQKINDYVSSAANEVMAPTLFNMGISAFKERDFNKAVAHFKDASKIITANPNLEYNLGLAYHVLGDNITAKKQYKKAREIRANQKTSESIKTVNNMAVLFVRAGMLDQARQMLEIASTEAPDDHDILYNLATVYRQAGDSETAIGLFKKVLAKNPSNEIHGFLAQEYFKVGDYAKFKEHTEAYVQSFIGKMQIRGNV